MKNFLKSILFLFIFAIIWDHVFSVLWITKNSTSYFYEEPKNTLDVVYAGASNVYAHFNPMLAYNQYGFTTGFLSAGAQPPLVIEYLIRNSRKYQNPKLYVIDLNQYSVDLSVFGEGDFRNSFDAMPFSKERIDAIDYILNSVDATKFQSKDIRTNYYFSFLKYHNIWKSVSKNNFVGNQDLYKAYIFNSGTIKTIPYEEYLWPSEKEDLPEINQNAILSLLSYLESEKLPVLFVVPKKLYLSRTHGVPERLNTLMDIVQQHNFPVINFNNLEDFQVDFNNDFYNNNHLNVYGATKYTLYFSTYLHNNYQLPDHRNDESFNSWNEEYDRFKSSYKKLTNNDFDKLVDEYMEIYA